MEAATTEIGELVLAAELIALEREERELSALRRRLHERIDLGFPNELLLAQERRVSAERRALQERIDVLRAQLPGLAAPTAMD
jgi:hypothetical protein